MISLRSLSEQRMQEVSVAPGNDSSLEVIIGRAIFNTRRWLRNRRELRGLDRGQMIDTGLTREVIEDACRLDLLRK
jgi:hypothetical protein